MSDSRLAASFDKMIVRLPDGMRDRFAELARANGRSANAEAVKAFEAWLDRGGEGEQAHPRLPEPLRQKLGEVASRNGRTILEEITTRLSDSFAAVPDHRDEGVAFDLRGEIRGAVREAIEDLLANPKGLERMGSERLKRRPDDDSVSE